MILRAMPADNRLFPAHSRRNESSVRRFRVLWPISRNRRHGIFFILI
jgi:hypothetical protein